MKLKRILITSFLLSAFTGSMAQNFAEGNYANWDFSPSGTYGNFQILNPKGRFHYKLEKDNPNQTTVKHINPTGIVIASFVVKYVNGILNSVSNINQWGNADDIITYKPITSTTFRVEEKVDGVNDFLPCKYAIYTFKNDLLSEERYFNAVGVLKENSRGYAIVRHKRYDSKELFAMSKETAYFDSADKPVISRQSRYHRVTKEYDSHANLLVECYFGADNLPLSINSGLQPKLIQVFNADDQKIRTDYKNEKNELVNNINGFAGRDFTYKDGFLSRATRKDAENNIVRSLPNSDKIAITEYEYDERGNLLKQSYFDEKSHPISNNIGVHGVKNVYSLNNLLLEKSYFDNFEKPTDDREKIHKYKYVYDQLGRVIQQSFFGVLDRPMKNIIDEVFMIKTEYDEEGRERSISYWKDSVTKMPRWSGDYKNQYSYDKEGNQTQYVILDKNDEPIRSESGYSSEKFIYSDQGYVLERQHIHGDTLVSITNAICSNYSILRYTFDQYSRIAEVTFYGIDKKPVNAEILIDKTTLNVQRAVFIYSGNRVIEQKLYQIGNDSPFKVIDCLKNTFLYTDGISLGPKNR